MPSQDAFAELAVEEQPRLRRLARRLARDSADADDLVQETYCRAWRYRGGFVPGPRGVGPWMATILHNARRAAARARQHATAVGAGGDGAAAVDALPDRDTASDARHVRRGDDLDAIADRLDGRLARALRDLPEAFRQPVMLWSVGGLACDEIAEQLGVPVGTVLSRLHRGRTRLAERLGGLAEEYGWHRRARARPGSDAA